MSAGIRHQTALILRNPAFIFHRLEMDHSDGSFLRLKSLKKSG
jgi:hypothetical protein